MGVRITQQIAMGVGAAGALEDVSSDAKLDAGVEYSWGRRSGFDGADAGRFSFTLDNQTGKYTPGNASSPLVTKVTEGMQVSWSCGGRLRVGTILSVQPKFPGGEAAWSEVLVTCDDMLGNAGRRGVPSPLTSAMVLGSTPYLYWPLNDEAGVTEITERSGRNQLPILLQGLSEWALGVAGFPALGTETQMRFANTGNFNNSALAGRQTIPQQFNTTIEYSSGSMGCWGAWFTRRATGGGLLVFVTVNGYATGASTNRSFRFGINRDGAITMVMGASTPVFGPALVEGIPVYMQMVVTNSGAASITGEFFVNGISYGSSVYTPVGGDPAGLATNNLRSPAGVRLWPQYDFVLPELPFSVEVAHVSHTATPVAEWAFNTGTEASALALVDQVMPEVTLATLPATLSTARVLPPDGGSALDAFNQIIATEQGEIYSTVTGTFLAPVERLTVRERTRPATVTASWNVSDEAEGAPEFVRDITNMVSSVTASGPFDEVLYTDTTLTGRVGSANVTETVLNTDNADLLSFAQDRSQRGANVQLRIASITVDAMTTPTDRTAALLALVPGDRHRFTNFPSAQLGFTTWDGWLLGCDEVHNAQEHKFTLHFQPVLPATAIYDTDFYMADGALSLSAGINAAVTTMSVATTTSLALLETVTFPYTLIVDAEQVTVTACTSATPQVATITRGVNGTTAASHSAAALVEVAVPSLYAF